MCYPFLFSLRTKQKRDLISLFFQCIIDRFFN
nr:MAG TPA: hypothetical protein [Bacteriophage sp.]DAY73113.1 MAG TPA: hypothetical protein [Caudoviricetes sp.]